MCLEIGQGGWKCDCAIGFTGSMCHIELDECSSEYSYLSISMELIISFLNVVKWIFDCVKIVIWRTSEAKIYPSKWSNFLCSKIQSLVIF